MNITVQVYQATDQLQQAKVTVLLLGYQKTLVVGHYHYGTSELPVGKVQSRRQYGNSNRYVNIYHHVRLLSGTARQGCAPFVLKTANINADKLMRLRSNLCLWGSPPPYSGKGRPRIHGNKFKLNDSQTWTETASISEEYDPKLGRIRVSFWHDLHFRSAASHPMSLILVERLNLDGSVRVTKPLWLAWVGQQMPPLVELWRLYLRRFGVDHWYRFLKQRLHWTLPKLGTPKQCERSL